MRAALKLMPSQTTQNRTESACPRIWGNAARVLLDMKFTVCLNWCLLFKGPLQEFIRLFHRKRSRHGAPSIFCFCSVDSQIRSVRCIFKNRKVNVLCAAPVLFLLILSDADYDKITAVLLKSRTGEFDLESILFLKLRGLGKILLIYHYLSLQECLYFFIFF